MTDDERVAKQYFKIQDHIDDLESQLEDTQGEIDELEKHLDHLQTQLSLAHMKLDKIDVPQEILDAEFELRTVARKQVEYIKERYGATPETIKDYWKHD